MITAIIGHDEFNGQVHFVRKREETAERPKKTADWSVAAYALNAILKKFRGPGFELAILGVPSGALPTRLHKRQQPHVDSNI